MKVSSLYFASIFETELAKRNPHKRGLKADVLGALKEEILLDDSQKEILIKEDWKRNLAYRVPTCVLPLSYLAKRNPHKRGLKDIG